MLLIYFIETANIEEKFASTVPITISPISGTDVNILLLTVTDRSSLSNSISPITDDLTDYPSSKVFLPEKYSSKLAIFSPGNLNSLDIVFSDFHNY